MISMILSQRLTVYSSSGKICSLIDCVTFAEAIGFIILILVFINWQCQFCRQDGSSKRLGRKEVNIGKR